MSNYFSQRGVGCIPMPPSSQELRWSFTALVLATIIGGYVIVELVKVLRRVARFSAYGGVRPSTLYSL